MTERRVGNPDKRRRGEAVRAVLLATVRPGQPMAVETVCSLVGVSRSRVLQHLYVLQEAKRIRGYSTARGVVRVW